MEELLDSIPKGWEFYTAYGTAASGRQYTVMLRADKDGVDAWHALSDEERDKVHIYVSAEGKTFSEALIECIRKTFRPSKD